MSLIIGLTRGLTESNLVLSSITSVVRPLTGHGPQRDSMLSGALTTVMYWTIFSINTASVIVSSFCTLLGGIIEDERLRCYLFCC